jgi:Mg2+ and Co2+ transporter CorA
MTFCGLTNASNHGTCVLHTSVVRMVRDSNNEHWDYLPPVWLKRTDKTYTFKDTDDKEFTDLNIQQLAERLYKKIPDHHAYIIKQVTRKQQECTEQKQKIEKELSDLRKQLKTAQDTQNGQQTVEVNDSVQALTQQIKEKEDQLKVAAQFMSNFVTGH